ncbi:hypothetical protein DFP72DRAFT_857817 [Ephemerocybe angulata]|uniref:Uncharacterized protein n=1 Tax=Ephemerocybe angulata TaxID=980116 RepID=A0A8H6HE66_9AGAR|nr:hypothetical protein DFP72DRAFT_857817 [Tulosesus angulatus]
MAGYGESLIEEGGVRPYEFGGPIYDSAPKLPSATNYAPSPHSQSAAQRLQRETSSSTVEEGPEPFNPDLPTFDRPTVLTIIRLYNEALETFRRNPKSHSASEVLKNFTAILETAESQKPYMKQDARRALDAFLRARKLPSFR